MYKLACVFSAVLAGSLVAACSDKSPSVAAPSSFSVASAPDVTGVSLGVTPSILVPQPDRRTSCAASQAFTIPLDLSVRAGALDVSLTDVTMGFTSAAGIPMPQVTLPAPVLTTQFGSMLIAARSQRTIPLVVPIGCTAETTGTLVIFVGTRDDHGRTERTEVRARVR